MKKGKNSYNIKLDAKTNFQSTRNELKVMRFEDILV